MGVAQEGWDAQVFNVLETVSQIAEEGMVEMLEHASLADDVAYTFGPYNCDTASASSSAPGRGAERRRGGAQGRREHSLSSLRMYLRAKVRPVSLRSTMRTLPKAPLPTTRSRRKWLRLTGWDGQWCWVESRAGGHTLVGEDDGLSVALTHGELQRRWPRGYGKGSRGISGGWSRWSRDRAQAG